MACTYTESMYLNIGTDICATITASRTAGSTNVHFDVTFSEDQKRGQTYYSWNLNAIKAKVNGYTDWITVKEYGNASSGSNSTSFDANVGNYDSGSRTFDVFFAVFNDNESATVGGTPSFQVSASWDASATAPSGLSVSVANRYVDGATFNVSISSYGSPSSVSGRYIEAEVTGASQTDYGASPRNYTQASNTSSAVISVRESTAFSNHGFTIQSNTKYKYGGFASNTVKGTGGALLGTFYTLPATPVGSSFQSTGTGTASFSVTDASSGSGQTIQLQYRYKAHSASSYGSWTNAGATGNKMTRTVNLTGLAAGTAYDIQVRAKAGSSDYSGVKAYENAFTTDQVSTTITGRSCAYNSSTQKANTTFSYVVSAVGSASDTYDINYSIKNGSTVVASGTVSNKETTGTFTVNSLPVGTSYTMTVKSRATGQTTWGTEGTYSFSTPTFVPGAPLISNVKWRSASGIFRQGITFNLTAATPGEGETFDKMYWKLEAYDSTTSQWTEVSAAQQVSATTLSGSMQTVYDPMRYPKLALSAWQTNNLGKTSPVSKVVYQNRPVVVGVIVPPSGSKKYVVGVKTKGTDGTLNSGNYAYPVVIR